MKYAYFTAKQWYYGDFLAFFTICLELHKKGKPREKHLNPLVISCFIFCHLSTAEQIKDLIEKFIKRQETISLVVVPANIDIATTEALKMANKVDPNGQRTLGTVAGHFSL